MGTGSSTATIPHNFSDNQFAVESCYQGVTKTIRAESAKCINNPASAPFLQLQLQLDDDDNNERPVIANKVWQPRSRRSIRIPSGNSLCKFISVSPDKDEWFLLVLTGISKPALGYYKCEHRQYFVVVGPVGIDSRLAITAYGNILLVFLVSRKCVSVVDDVEVDELAWIKMENLGDTTLFLGANRCTSVQAKLDAGAIVSTLCKLLLIMMVGVYTTWAEAQSVNKNLQLLLNRYDKTYNAKAVL